jgi:hypothetical protein
MRRRTPPQPDHRCRCHRIKSIAVKLLKLFLADLMSAHAAGSDNGKDDQEMDNDRNDG